MSELPRGAWRGWWAIPLSLLLAEFIQKYFSFGLMEVLRGRHPEWMGTQAGAERFSALVGNCLLVFSLLFTVLIGLVLRRFFTRRVLLRSATAAAVYLVVIQLLSPVLPVGAALILCLPWGPLTALQTEILELLGSPSGLPGQIFSLCLAAASPYLFVLFGKREPTIKHSESGDPH